MISGKPEAGLTLVEVMLALAVLAIGLTALIATASRCLSVVSQSRSYATSRNLITRVEVEKPLILEEKIEVGSESGGFGYDHPGYRWTRDIEMVGKEEDGLFSVRTRVYWSERSVELYDEVITYLYKPEEKESGTTEAR
ncbi:MAG: hypothetical protein BWY59_00425 [Verrucomicrobia bacterium ADurb.Bin345]|nr:MAG: hypothetical protein BWY59_00425 [Verrucomicrobia bacterium ADurb.Bin345]